MRSALFFALDRRPPRSEVADFVDTLRPGTRSMRLEVCPPAAPPGNSWLDTLRAWLAQGWPAGRAASPRPAPRGAALSAAQSLVHVKQEFADAVSDLDTPQGAELLDRIQFARSLRELWHLRADVFSRVAVYHSQEEAAERLAWLNRHFPTRSPRSGFGALTSKDMWP